MANIQNYNDILVAVPKSQLEKLISLAIDNEITIKVVETVDVSEVREMLYEMEYESSDEEYYNSSC